MFRIQCLLACGIMMSALPCASGANPTVLSVSPSSGSGLAQTFAVTYSENDPDHVVYLDIGNAGVGEPHSCFVAYVIPPNNDTNHGLFYLFNDDNSSVSGPIGPGDNSSLSNSQCTISGTGAMAIVSGTLLDRLTVSFPIAFASTYTGSKKIYGLAQTFAAQQSPNTLLGTWTPAPQTLAALSVSPINGSGTNPATFNAFYSDSSRATDVQVAYLIFGGSPQPVPHGCFVAYVPFGNALYLFNDDDTGVVNGSPVTAGTDTSLSNSQCTLSGSGGTATLQGNNFTAPFQITFKSSFTGQHNVYGLVQSYDGAQSAAALLGTWTL